MRAVVAAVVAAGLAFAGYNLTSNSTTTLASQISVAKVTGSFQKGIVTVGPWFTPAEETGYVMLRDGVQIATAGPAATSTRFSVTGGQHTLEVRALLGTTTTTTTATTTAATTTTTAAAPPSGYPNALGPFGQVAPAWDTPSLWRSDSASLLLSAYNAATNGSPLAVTAYGIAFYHATASDPQTSVKNLNGWGNATGTTTFRLPAGAKASSGGDAHLAVVQPDGTTLEMWQAVKQSDGTWTAGAVGIAQPGQFTYPFAVCMGSSFTLMDGTVTPDDVKAGVINHALTIALPMSVVSKSFVYPSNASDGTLTGGIPEGSRLVLDPNYDISGLTGLKRAVAQALKTYGAFVGDRSGNDVTTSAVSPESWTSIGLPDPWAAQGLSGYPDTGIRELLTHMRIAA